MKRFIYLIVYILILVSCSEGKMEKMRHGLDSLNTLNKTDKPFTSDDVQPYTDYFNQHGTPNDQLLAYYLLGRAYHEQGDAPMALQAYYDAIEKTDTTNKDCNYYVLSRCYAQTADILYQQNLTHDNEVRDKAIRYAFLSGDTLAALSDYEQKCSVYERNGKPDSALLVIDSLINWYKANGYEQDAAISCGRAFSILVNQNDMALARKYMHVYEAASGLFDMDGTICQGREVFYYFKALLLMNENKLDSAELWLRKELHDGKDHNNQNAASKGLALLFEKKQQADSAVKYALYSYAMNDSVYAHMATREVEQMQEMFDYSRHQKQAREQTERTAHERSVKQYITMILVVVCILSYLTIRELSRKRKEENRRYQMSLATIAQQQAEVIFLRQHAQDYELLISEKEQQIDIQKQELKKYRKSKKVINAEKHLQESVDYQHLTKLAVKGQVPTDDEWHRIYKLIIEFLPDFNDFITSKKHQLNIKEYNTCILLRLHLKSQDISHMLEVSPAYISKICSEMTQKIFQEKGNVRQLTERLNAFC